METGTISRIRLSNGLNDTHFATNSQPIAAVQRFDVTR